MASKVWAAWLERGRHVPQQADTGDRGFSTWVSRMHRRAGGNWSRCADIEVEEDESSQDWILKCINSRDQPCHELPCFAIFSDILFGALDCSTSYWLLTWRASWITVPFAKDIFWLCWCLHCFEHNRRSPPVAKSHSCEIVHTPVWARSQAQTHIHIYSCTGNDHASIICPNMSKWNHLKGSKAWWILRNSRRNSVGSINDK